MRSKQKWASVAAGLFGGGGLANVYERLAFGDVFDYLNFSTSFFDNPFSFNLADIYIFLGLVLYLVALSETHDLADSPMQPRALRSLAMTLGNFGLTLARIVSCLYLSWQVLSRANFLYDHIYEHNNLEAHVNEFAALNRNGKERFALTTNAERVRVFTEIAREINTGGGGFDTISFVGTGEATSIPFLIEAERDHLQDVANLVTSMKPLGA